MGEMVLSLEDQAVLIRYPESLHHQLRTLLGPSSRAARLANAKTIVIEADGDPNRYALQAEGRPGLRGLDQGECLNALFCEVGQSLLENLSAGVALHAGAVVRRDLGVVVPGQSGCGKSSLIAWLLDNGFDYLTDDLVVFQPDLPRFTALGRPLILRQGVREKTATFGTLASAPSVTAGASTFVVPSTNGRLHGLHECRLLVFPRFADGEKLTIEALSAAEAGLELMACNVNARNLPNHGFDMVVGIARSVPAVRLRYGSFDVLPGALDDFIDLVLRNNWDPKTFRKILGSLGVAGAPAARKQVEAPTPSTVPAPTPRGKAKKLTIGMATYDDYDGVYFSLQALRMYHPEILDDIELVVVDNNPSGRCGQHLKRLESSIPNYRYVPYSDRAGTRAREIVFAESNAELVLCMDCHVFIVPGAVEKLIAYCDARSDTKDLLQGPIVYDNLEAISTHCEPRWNKGMFGCWATDPRGKDPEAEPFEIPMQGLGLFACRRSAWPGFNPHFRGFGGEEGYLHEKFRQAGGRALCLPFLRWMHRFQRPLGVPYVNTWEDRLRNYMIGFSEVGWDTRSVEEQFTKLLGPGAAAPMIARVKAELSNLSNLSDLADERV